LFVCSRVQCEQIKLDQTNAPRVPTCVVRVPATIRDSARAPASRREHSFVCGTRLSLEGTAARFCFGAWTGHAVWSGPPRVCGPLTYRPLVAHWRGAIRDSDPRGAD